MELKIFPYVAGDGSGKRKVRASVPGKPQQDWYGAINGLGESTWPVKYPNSALY